MSTKTVITESGLEVEYTYMTGAVQEALTLTTNLENGGGLEQALLLIVKRIGSKTNIEKADILSLPPWDRAAILVASRNYTTDNESYAFTVNFGSYEGANGVMLPNKVEVVIDPTKHDWCTKKPCRIALDGSIIEVVQYKELSDLKQDNTREVWLPFLSKTVRFSLLNGYGEALVRSYEEKDISAHTTILIRQPKFVLEGGSLLEVKAADLNNMHAKDLSLLRNAIANAEGKFETTVTVTNPRNKNDKHIVNILGELDFFFPGVKAL